MEFTEPEATSKVISEITERLLVQLDSLFDTVNRIMLIVHRSTLRARTDYRTFVDGHSKPGDAHLTLSGSEFPQHAKLRNAMDKAIEANRIVPRSFAVSMITQFDAFEGALIRELFKLRPEKLQASGKSLLIG